MLSSWTPACLSPMQSPKANKKQKTWTETKDQIWNPTGDGGDNSGLYLREAQSHPAELAHSRLLFTLQCTFLWPATSFLPHSGTTYTGSKKAMSSLNEVRASADTHQCQWLIPINVSLNLGHSRCMYFASASTKKKQLWLVTEKVAFHVVSLLSFVSHFLHHNKAAARLFTRNAWVWFYLK